MREIALRNHSRFTLRGELGAGAMGVVYRAFDEERQEEVALKTISEVDATRLFHLKQEFRAAVDLHHPNLVQLHELIVEEDAAFFTMELIEGHDLLSWIRSDAPPYQWGDHDVSESTIDERVGGRFRRDNSSMDALPAPWDPTVAHRIERILPQLASGLAALHDAGVIHRDIKPSNILVDADGRAAFLDFGVSVHRDWFQTERLSLAGTLAYMAPEQFLSSDLDPASDIYALGVVLYEALTGLVPHRGVRHAEAFERKLHTPPPPPRDLVPEIPEALAALTLSLLHPNPHARPTAHALNAHLGQRPPQRRAAFCGRIDELATLKRAFRDVQQKSAPHIVHVTGPSGIGKTAFVEQGGAMLRAQGATVLRGRCLPHESTPFRALDTLVDNLTRILIATDDPESESTIVIPEVLVRLFPVFARAPGAPKERSRRDLPLPELRRVGATALREVFSALCRTGPVVVWIDDFQWSDLGSIPLISELMNGADAPPILFVFGYRSDQPETEAQLTPMLRQEHQRFVPLPPLQREEASALVHAHLGAHHTKSERLERAIDEVGGLPFLLLQLASAVADAEVEEAVLAEPAAGSFLTRRVARLSIEEQRILEVVSLADQPIARHIVEGAAGIGDINRHLKDLIRGRLVCTVLGAYGHALVPVHDRIRASVVDLLDPVRAESLHAALADAYAADPTAPDHAAIARHRAESGDTKRASEHAQVAAAQAMDALAFEQALTQYALASLCDPSLDANGDFLRARGRAKAAQGNAADAAEDYLRAASVDARTDSFDDLRTAAELLIGCGRLEQGRVVLHQVLAGVGVSPSPSRGQTLARLGWDRLQLWRKLRALPLLAVTPYGPAHRRADACGVASSLLGFLDSLQSFGVHTQFVRAALDSRDPGRVARAVALDRIYLGPMGKRPAGTARFDALLDELRPQVTTPDDRAFLTLMDGYNAFLWGHFEAAADYLADAEAHYAREGLARWERSLCRNLKLAALEFGGRLADVAAGYDNLLPVFVAVDDRLGADLLRIGVGCSVALMRDRSHESRELLYECAARWRDTLPPTFRLSALTASVRNDLYDGEPARALERLADAHVVRNEMGAFQSARIMLAWLQGLAAAQATRQDRSRRARQRAATQLASAHQALRRENGGWGTGLEHLLHAAHLRHTDAERALEAANTAHDTLMAHGPLPLYALGAKLLAAEIRGDTDFDLTALAAVGVANPQQYRHIIAPC